VNGRPSCRAKAVFLNSSSADQASKAGREYSRREVES